MAGPAQMGQSPPSTSRTRRSPSGSRPGKRVRDAANGPWDGCATWGRTTCRNWQRPPFQGRPQDRARIRGAIQPARLDRRPAMASGVGHRARKLPHLTPAGRGFQSHTGAAERLRPPAHARGMSWSYDRPLFPLADASILPDVLRLAERGHARLVPPGERASTHHLEGLTLPPEPRDVGELPPRSIPSDAQERLGVSERHACQVVGNP
jgi:hypothetical protein